MPAIAFEEILELGEEDDVAKDGEEDNDAVGVKVSGLG